MSEDLFDTINFYDHDFHCANPENFKQLINIIETGANPESLHSYIKSNGSLNDVCFMKRYGNGEQNVAWIGKAIINGGNISTLKELIKIDPTHIGAHDHEYCLLSYAIITNYAMAHYLLDQGSDPNFNGHRRKTPLYYAISKRNVDIVTKLINLGANPNNTYGMANTNYLYHAVNNLYLMNSRNNSTLESKTNLIQIINLLMKSNAIIQKDKLSTCELKLINTIIL